jgi:hypothetical protein
MTVYSRVRQLYSDEVFETSLHFAGTSLRRSVSTCSTDSRDLRIAARDMDMEDPRLACFYPERLQRLNLEGFSVLHAASCFYRD